MCRASAVVDAGGLLAEHVVHGAFQVGFGDADVGRDRLQVVQVLQVCKRGADAVAGGGVDEREGALVVGTPFFVGPDMGPVEPLCSYFFELSKTAAASMADYAGDLMYTKDFLTGLDPPSDLLSGREDDLVAYREDRTLLQESPVSAATWRRRQVALNGFYDWVVYEGLVERRP